MKTMQDWSFSAKDDALIKPKIQENKIFHALTTAYENKQQGELFGATETIVKREKELCELAMRELQRIGDGKSEQDGTVKLIIEHYHNRLELAREKEIKINSICDDSRKMMEEYRKKNQELAEVKRNLMESQTKLRELAKVTEKLIKKEEELRFIENNLRAEIDKNKLEIINGLYEIVTDLSEQGSEDLAPTPSSEPAVSTAPVSASAVGEQIKPITVQKPDIKNKPMPVYDEDLKSKEVAAADWAAEQYKKSSSRKAMGDTSDGPRWSALWEKAESLKNHEPGKDICSKSLVKNPSGEIVSEYFYQPGTEKGQRHYIFDSRQALSGLLLRRTQSADDFKQRIELVFMDLITKLEQNRNIHLEASLSEEFNQDIILKLLSSDKREQDVLFERLTEKILVKLQLLGSNRARHIIQQFKSVTKS